MSTEIELKLHIPAKSVKKLATHPKLAGLKEHKQVLLNTYYDTPSLALHNRRIAVRYRKKGWQWLLTVKSAEPASGGLAVRNEWETPANPGEFDFSHVDHEELRAFLENARPELEPVFTTDFRRRIWHVPIGNSIIELAADRGHIHSQGRQEDISEIELELLSGDVVDIFRLTRHLQRDIDLMPALASKAERGYRLFLNQIYQPFKAKAVRLDEGTPPIDAFRSIALNCLEHFQRNEIGLHISDNPEFIHQSRVALRRLRSAIKLFAPILPPDFVSAYGKTWQTLAGALGEARNWDVFLHEMLPPVAASFPQDKEIRRIKVEAQKQSRYARKSVLKLLSVSEYARLLMEFTAAIYTLGHQTNHISLEDFSNRQLTRHTKKAARLARAHPSHSPEARHKMRIAFKKLRYTLEFFQPLLPARKNAAHLAALCRLQDMLGAINDHATAEGLIAKIPRSLPQSTLAGWIAGRHRMAIDGLPEYLDEWLQYAPSKPAKQIMELNK